jgi:hypothetical protein
MNPNLASLMPQIIAVWCEEAGHDVRFICYTGFENLDEELRGDTDLLIIGGFTQAAQLSYSISNMFRRRGAVTALGGPHARCYPQDAAKYFDYVLGFTDRNTLDQVLRDCSRHRPIGRLLSAARQPLELPGVAERWKFISPTIAKAPTIKIVPMIGSLGCPYTCSFCIDAAVDYRPLSFEQIKEDLKFLLTKLDRPIVGWHDPNFGVRFDEYMNAIEEAVPPGRVDFIAESSLSILSEPHLKRLKANGFKAILPGIESWFDVGNKSGTGRNSGMEKVRRVSSHVNLILEYIPYVQTNFVLGLDSDEGSEPFELTKRFIDMTPGAFPGFSLLTSFGQAAVLNLDFQRAGRVIPVPFHFLNNNHAMNVRPLNYSWPDFYNHVIELTSYAFSWPRISRRLWANRGPVTKGMNFVRAVSSEGFGRVKYHKAFRHMLNTDSGFHSFFKGQNPSLPAFFSDRVRQDLGSFWEMLPEGALEHDPYAYLQSQNSNNAAYVTPAAPETALVSEA